MRAQPSRMDDGTRKGGIARQSPIGKIEGKKGGEDSISNRSILRAKGKGTREMRRIRRASFRDANQTSIKLKWAG